MSVFYFKSPLGVMKISVENVQMTGLDFVKSETETDEISDSEEDMALADLCITQLQDYFEKKQDKFDLPLSYKGTDFQKKVWNELLKIPYGQTISYQELAIRLGDPKCIRAAASANGRNPFAIIVPCHRVIGKDGSLTGYASGLWRKQWLLELEGALFKSQPDTSRQLSLF